MKKCLRSMLFAIVLVIGIMSGTVSVNAASTDNSQTGEYGKFIDGAHVIEDLIERNGMNAHPRIIMSEEKFAQLRTHIGDGSATALLLEELRGEADRHVREDPVATYETDDEGHLLETSKRIQRRVAALALAYNIFGDDKYAERAYKELKAASNFSDWSPKHFLDTAEMCTAFAFGYDWLYDWLNPAQRELLRTSMIKKGLKQVMEDYTDTPHDRKRTYKWYQDLVGDNWQLVCTGGTNLAALAIGDEPDAREIASEVLTYGYKRAYSFVRRAYSTTDGTYIEGLGYWDYATYYLGLQSSALISTVGTDYGLADYEGVKKSVDFVRYMSSNTPKSFSFGDDRESRDTGWPVFLWLGEHFNSPELSAIRLRKIDEDKEFRFLDVLWIDESKQSNSGNDNATDWGAVGACNASFRNTWDVSGLVAALHVGENCYKYHGHYDLGSFYVEANGSRFFTDLGNESYSLENRQVSYRIKAEGHNTLVINPTKEIDQREGANCLITEFESGNEAYAVTDLTDAYGPSDARSVIRGLKMMKDKECVVIQDEISLNHPGEIYWFAHTKGTIEVAADGRSAIVTVGSDRLWVGLFSEGGQFTVMKAEPLPTSLTVSGATSNNEYRKLAIHLTNTKDTTISVACIPLKNGEVKPSWTPAMEAISEWSRGGEEQSLLPEILAQPVNATAAEGKTVKFSVNAANASAYQWQYSKDGGKTWTNNTVSSANRATLSLTTKGSWDGRLYHCIVTNEAGSVTTEAAGLTVKIAAPVISEQPADAAAMEGDTVTFKALATGTGLTYQWQYSKDGGITWTNNTVSSAKKATLSLATKFFWDGRLYHCIVTNAGGSVTTEAVRLTVKQAAPVINEHPADVTAAEGSTVTFKTVAAGTGLTYRWQYSKDGGKTWINSTAASAKTATLSFTAKTSYNGRLYRCVVTNEAGSVNTATAVLTVN